MLTTFKDQNIIEQIDPRLRIVSCFILAFIFALSNNFTSASLLLPFAVTCIVLSSLTWKQTAKRLIEINIFMLFLFIFFPFSVKGSVLFQFAGFYYSYDGLLKSALIAFKANCIMITVAGLAGTMEPTTLGHSLQLLRIPKKFILIFLFMVRYLDVMADEFQRMKTAMKLRSFQAKVSLHTFRTYGNLIGMVLVRSMERSERIMTAMKCRCFNGIFYPYYKFQLRRIDLYFVLSLLFFLSALAYKDFVL